MRTLRTLVLLLLLLALGVPPSWAAVTVDATSTGTFDGTDSHVVSSCSDRLLTVLAWTSNGNNISAVTSNLDGALTLAGTVQTWQFAAIDHAIAIFYKVAPSVGTHVLTETHNGSANYMGATSFCGVHQSTPIGTPNGNDDDGLGTTPATVDVASAGGELVIDAVYGKTGDLMTAGAGQTQQWQSSPSGSHRFAQSTEAGAGTVTMSWTLPGSNETWGIVAMSLKPSAAAGGVTPRRALMGVGQ